MKIRGLFFVISMCISMLVGCGGKGDSAVESSAPVSPSARVLITNGSIPSQLVIEGVAVEAPVGGLTITGFSFDNGAPPQVFLGALALPVASYTANEIVITGIDPDDLVGEFILTVRTGATPANYDAYYYMHAVSDPQGPAGQLIVQAAQGDFEAGTGDLIVEIYGWNLDGTPPSVTVGPLPALIIDFDDRHITARIPSPGELDGTYLLLVQNGPGEPDRDAYILDLEGASEEPVLEDGAICHPSAPGLCWRNGPEKNFLGKKIYFQVLEDYQIDLAAYFQDKNNLPPLYRFEFFREGLLEQLMGMDVEHEEFGWDYLSLEEGILTVRKGYRWDGPSTHRINKLMEYMRSSMVHDILYDFMRLRLITPDGGIFNIEEDGTKNRLVADTLFYMIAVEDGRPPAFAELGFEIIRLGGAPRTRLYLHEKWPWKFHSVAEAGPDLTLSCGPGDFLLDATGSRFADVWLWTKVLPDIFFSPDPTATAPLSLGENEFHLLVTDTSMADDEHWPDFDMAIITVEEDVEPPVFGPTPDIQVGNDPGLCAAAVAYEVTATDSCALEEVSCLPASGDSFPVGTTLVQCTALDASGNSATASFNVIVDDVEPPVIEGDDTPLVVWPPDHSVTIFTLDDFSIAVTDNCGGVASPTVIFSEVTSDEADNAKGDGHTTGDIDIDADGQSVALRIERQGGGDGRVYSLTVEAGDSSGNLATDGYEIHVLHDRSD